MYKHVISCQNEMSHFSTQTWNNSQFKLAGATSLGALRCRDDSFRFTSNAVYHRALAVITNCGAHTCHPTLWVSEMVVARRKLFFFWPYYNSVRTLWAGLSLGVKLNRTTHRKHQMATKQVCSFLAGTNKEFNVGVRILRPSGRLTWPVMTNRDHLRPSQWQALLKMLQTSSRWISTALFRWDFFLKTIRSFCGVFFQSNHYSHILRAHPFDAGDANVMIPSIAKGEI